MDAYVDLFQSHGGSMVMLAKGNRSPAVTAACKKHGGFYLGSIGGPAARLAKDCIKKVEVLEYPELGMEAVWKIDVVDFPAFIVVDDKGNDFFAGHDGPTANGTGRQLARSQGELGPWRKASTSTVWQYPKCSTCRKALKWLQAHGVRGREPRHRGDAARRWPSLRDLFKRSGLPIARFFNTSGESYRAGGFKERLKTMSEAEALAALAADGKLIKRPLVDTGDAVLVGFDETAYTRVRAPQQ